MRENLHPINSSVRKLSKKEKLEKDKKRQNDTSRPQKDDNVKDERFDFGGLPDRNLKRNLGCG